MKEDNKELVTRFVQLVRVHAWDHPVALSKKERGLCKQIVEASGYLVHDVVARIVDVECIGADQRPTGRRRVLNVLSKHAVISADEHTAHAEATAWLDDLVLYVRNAHLEIREHEQPALVHEVCRLIQKKRHKFTPVPEGTTTGTSSTVHDLPFTV